MVRAFARDLIGADDVGGSPNFVELDSYQISDRETMLSLKDYIFQEVPGHKVVLFDEWHLVDPTVQSGLLKDIEDSRSPIFFFFVSTERSGILDTIISRSLDFTLTKYTRDQLLVYLDFVLSDLGIEISPQTKDVIIFRSFGHIRNLLNQIELLLVMSEQSYYQNSSGIITAVENLLTAPSADTAKALAVYPFTLVQETLDFIIHERLICQKMWYKEGYIPQIFNFYLKFKKLITDDNDFFSFAILFAEFLASIKARG